MTDWIDRLAEEAALMRLGAERQPSDYERNVADFVEHHNRGLFLVHPGECGVLPRSREIH